jgi:predicted alpha/beta superfamily hydrolase
MLQRRKIYGAGLRIWRRNNPFKMAWLSRKRSIVRSRWKISPNPEKIALLGSSMGGLATLYGVARYPELFRTGFAFSPHWVVGEYALVDALLAQLPSPERHKIWMSRGTKSLDAQYQPFQDYADQQLKSFGWEESSQFTSRIFTGDRHSERSWRRQVEPALQFWLDS